MATNFVDLVQTVAPELKTEQSDTINLFVAMAMRRIDMTVFGIYYTDAVTYLAAHLLTMKKRRGASGATTMLKVGDVEAQYQGMMPMRSGLFQTSYGIEYLELRKLVVITPITV